MVRNAFERDRRKAWYQRRLIEWLLYDDWRRRQVRVAPARVASQVASAQLSGTTTTITWPSNTTAGNFLAAVISSRNESSVTAPGWVTATSKIFQSSRTLYIMYAENCSAVSTTVFTTDATAQQICAAEYSGMATSSSLDTGIVASAVGTSTTPASGATGTSTQADELWIGAIGTISNITFSLPTNSFLIYSTDSAGIPNAALLDQVVSSTGTANAGCTISSSVAWAAAVAAFKGAAAATGQPASCRMGGVKYAHKVGGSQGPVQIWCERVAAKLAEIREGRRLLFGV